MRKNLFALFLIVFINTFQGHSQITLDSGLVAYYPFNGNAGDSSVYGNHPSFNNATLTNDRFGNANSAYRFNGSSQYMRIPNTPSLNMANKISVCAWVKVEGFYKGLCHGNRIINKSETDVLNNGNYALTFDDANYTNANCSNPIPDTLHEEFYGCNVSDTSVFVRRDAWHHLVYTYDGNIAKMYVDSRLVNTQNSAGYYFTNSSDLFFGRMNNASYPYWYNGFLDDVRIYNRTLSDSDVTKLYVDAAPYPTIKGQIFVDENSNGVLDATDYPKANVRVDLSNGKYTFSDVNGNYELVADSIGAYSVTAQPPAFYTAAPTTSTYFFNTYTAKVVNNIALQPTVIKDSLSILVFPLAASAVPSGAFPYWVEYENAGTTVLSPTLYLTNITYKLNYDSCSDVSATAIADGMVSGKTNMQPGTQENIVSYFTINQADNVGDTLQINYGIGDANAGISYNNSFYNLVEGSIADNGQRATPSLTTSQVASGKEIFYTIGFKNTTNSSVLDVVIEDSLSGLLQANTFKMLASSHKCKATVKGNRILMELMDIKIPTAATNPLKSLGFVSFSITPKSTLVAGTTITSKAYTSYNNLPPIVTTATTLVKPIVTPVKLLIYDVRYTIDKKVENKWKTVNEINTSHFNVQRSVDGREFKTVGTIAAKGFGSYSFADNQLPVTNNKLTLYYRIEIVDKDGSKTYSEVKQVVISKEQLAISVFPNPAKTSVNIECKGAKELLITDYLGKEVYKSIINSPSTIVNLKSFAKGVYLVSIITSEGKATKKLVVE